MSKINLSTIDSSSDTNLLLTAASTSAINDASRTVALGRWVTRGNLTRERNVEFLPYHWDDRELLHSDALDCWTEFNSLVRLMGSALNQCLNQQRSERFWRIAVGPWLLLTLEILCDRHRSLDDLRRIHLDLPFPVDLPCLLTPPVSSSHFRELVSSDEFNQAIYAYLAGSSVEYGNDRRSSYAPIQRSLPRRLINSALATYSRLLPSALNRAVFITSYFPLRALTSLQVSLGQAPYPRAPEITLPPSPIDLNLRNHLREILSDLTNTIQTPAWVQSCIELTPHLLPRTLLEGFQLLLNAAYASLPRSPKIIISGNAHIADDAAQLWMADRVESGSKLFVVQHGGHYGTGRWSSTDEFEISIADKFLTWGWDRKNSPTSASKVIPLDAPKLIGVAKRLRSNPRLNAKARILLTLNALPRYSYRTYSVPVAGQFLNYLDNVAMFCNELPAALRSLLLVRFHPRNWGWIDMERFAELSPGVELYRGNIRLESQLAQSRLFVATHNATTFLETLAANFPTVIFWEPRYYELNNDASSYFEQLASVGIWHRSSSAAAAHVSEIAADPRSWWGQRHVQEAREEFIRRFANVTPDWLNNWRTMLLGAMTS